MLKTRLSSLRGWWYQSGGCWVVQHFDYWHPVSCQFYFHLSSFVASDKAPALKSQVEHRSYRHAVKLIDSASCWSAQYTPAMFIHWENHGINYSIHRVCQVKNYVQTNFLQHTNGKQAVIWTGKWVIDWKNKYWWLRGCQAAQDSLLTSWVCLLFAQRSHKSIIS